MIGRTLSHCRIISGIAADGMGTACPAEHVRPGRDVALGVLPAEGADEAGAE